MDGFMGAGGNTIQFAKLLQDHPLYPTNFVLACDKDSKKTKLVRENCKVYKIPN